MVRRNAVNAGIGSGVVPLALYHRELDLQTGAFSPVDVTVRFRKPGLTKVTDLMTEHDPPPATDPPPWLDVRASPAGRPLPPALAPEEVRRPALELLERLYQARAITLTELDRGRRAILRGELDDLLVPALGDEGPPPNRGSAQGAPRAGRSIGDYLRQGEALGG